MPMAASGMKPTLFDPLFCDVVLAVQCRDVSFNLVTLS